jgi:hypothetical protein
MIDLDKQTIDDLKARHGELRAFSLDRGGQRFVVRGPSEVEFQRALDKIGDGGRRKTEAILEVGQACLVFPDAAEASKIASAKPGLYLTAGNEAMQIAGVVDTFSEKL